LYAVSVTLKQQRRSVVEPKVTAAETERLEHELRPRRLSEYVGQVKVKEHLTVHLGAARSRGEPLGHTLFHGPPGIGKTTLAHIVAHEMQTNLRITSGPAIEKPGDLASLLTNLSEGDVLFIDEIHRLRPVIEEVLYAAMEEYALDIVLGKGPSARSMRIRLRPFTLVGATTKVGAMSAPLRDRFIHAFKIGFYAVKEIEQVLKRSAGILKVDLDSDAAVRLAACSRATPRIANRLLRTVRDFAVVNGESRITLQRTKDTLRSLEVDQEGLDATDRAILSTVIEKFAGGPVGLSTIAASLSEEEETIEDVYEPYLLQLGFLKRTPQGRMATPLAYEHFGIERPGGAQLRLSEA
jgi:Holliday junction DNA helicase RuvB